MMSLFSSFDLFFWNFQFILMVFIFCSFSFSVWKINLYNLIFNMTETYMKFFFFSLKEKKFDKLSLSAFFCIFFSIFLINLLGNSPFYFSLSSQLSIVLTLSLNFWICLIIFSLFNTTKSFLLHFIPESTPMPLIPLLFLIEIISSLIRPITLTVRLCANILAGHLLMILLCKLVLILNLSFTLFFFLNLIELFVGLIQSYIFCTMICLYFSEIH